MVGILVLSAVQALCSYPANPAEEPVGRHRERAEACRARLAADSGDIEAYRVLASALLDRPTERLSVLEAAMRVAPHNWEFAFNAGLTLRVLERFEESLAMLERAAELDSGRYGESLVQAGLVAQRLGRHDRAIDLFRGAIEARDQRRTDWRYMAWGYMARSLFAVGRNAAAVDAWDRAERGSSRGFIDEAGDRAAYERAKTLARSGGG